MYLAGREAGGKFSVFLPLHDGVQQLILLPKGAGGSGVLGEGGLVVLRADQGPRGEVRIAGVDGAVAVGGDGAGGERVPVISVRAPSEVGGLGPRGDCRHRRVAGVVATVTVSPGVLRLAGHHTGVIGRDGGVRGVGRHWVLGLHGGVGGSREGWVLVAHHLG